MNLAEHPEIYRFAVVGAAGFVVDAGAFTVLLLWLQEPLLSRLGSFLVAVGVTLMLNRRFTFIRRPSVRPLAYFASQGIGAAINMLVFAAVIWHPIWLPWQYYLGLASGAFVAMVFNYEMSRRYVFV